MKTQTVEERLAEARKLAHDLAWCLRDCRNHLGAGISLDHMAVDRWTGVLAQYEHFEDGLEARNK